MRADGGQNGGPGRHASGGAQSERERYQLLGDADLIAALRRGEPRAFEEFVSRFHRGVLAQARRAGIPMSERDSWAVELLHDVALQLVRSDVRVNRPIAAYLTGACRNKLQQARRVAARERTRSEMWRTDATEPTGRVVAELCSEYTVRASRNALRDPASTSSVVDRLAHVLDAQLTPNERQLLAWVSSYVPQRQIAEWLGIKHMAAAQRIHRLCVRLREEARRFEESLDDVERAELRRFLRRATPSRMRSRGGER
ncbi:MAG TPA: hypothetical protein VJ596_10875 [Gemmatimonadaceae bacterium]|nr:hypothetical protein [Gemmatimonadaceae bacterium]